MYVDSTNETEPSGEMPVSRLLIEHIEPLLIVRSIHASNVAMFIVQICLSASPH